MTTLSKAKKQPPLKTGDTCTTSFMCMPWDIDPFMEMNNGKILTLYDLGRFAVADRIGLTAILKSRQWGMVVAGSTVMYRKRIRMFDRVTMHTQVTSYDDRWIYITQSMWLKGEPASSVLLRMGVTEKGRVISSDVYKDVLNLDTLQSDSQQWVDSWVSSETHRPWPPGHQEQ